MAAKQTLYKLLEVRPDASPEVIKAAYEARQLKLADAVSAEDLGNRAMLRDAYAILADPVQRKQYDERLRHEQTRALASGMAEERPRPANSRAQEVQAAGSAPFSVTPLLFGLGALIVAGAAGFWVYSEHQHKMAAKRLEAEKLAAEERRYQAEAQRRDEMMQAARDRAEANRQASEYRQRQYDIERSRQVYASEVSRQSAQQAAEERRKQAEQRSAESAQNRAEQENVRRSQMQLEREKRYLRELEGNRPHKF